ncbi:MAG: dockerin type I repeat-containing protein, partial [Oscillospiraceae bacterium]|nr:dockerin type I repeat-containing protein [Oscillospiraceae bacterium]
AIWDSSNDYSREGMASEEESGKSLNECPEECDRITLYVDGKHVWGTAPEGCPEPEGYTEPISTTKVSDIGKSDVSYGDVNCDKEVDVSDAVLLARLVAEDAGANVTAQGKLNADCLKDGNLNGDDVIRILQYVAKLINYSVLGTK